MLEATVAIMLVSGVLISVYTKQASRPDSSDFIFGLQKKILMDISSRSDLRLEVLKGDPSNIVASFVGAQLGSSYGYALRVCDLGNSCELASTTSIDNFRNDVDVFVEDTIISAVVTNETHAYTPKKVRLFIWELG